jgi:hypothetical protein
VGSSEIFVEEHDYGIDLMTKNHPDPFWHLKDKIKTPGTTSALQTGVANSVYWIFTLFGGCHLSRRVQMTSQRSVRC